MLSQVGGRKQKLPFNDPSEGDVELADADVKDDERDDTTEQEGDQEGGEESKTAEKQTNEDIVTLSTFGHSSAENAEKKSDAKGGEEEKDAKLDDKVTT